MSSCLDDIFVLLELDFMGEMKAQGEFLRGLDGLQAEAFLGLELHCENSTHPYQTRLL